MVESTAQKTTSPTQRGVFRIFFSYAPYAGTSYAMLQAAHAEHNMGKDVVIGYLATNTSAQTLNLAGTLPWLETTVSKQFRTALARKPDIVLFDNLARHLFLFTAQSSLETELKQLLAAGISVWTTLELGQVERLAKLSHALTSRPETFTVPDELIALADSIEFIDIAPKRLLERYQSTRAYQDKITNPKYLGTQLTQLKQARELALRYLAELAQTAKPLEHTASPSQDINEHILVCLSGAPGNSKLLHIAAEMAQLTHAKCTAIHITTPQEKERKSVHTQRQANRALAEELGIHIVSLQGTDIPELIATYARSTGITRIITGSTTRRFGFWWGKRSIVDKIVALVPEIDTIVIPDFRNTKESLGEFFGSVNLLDRLRGKGLARLSCWLILGATLSLCTGINFVNMHMNIDPINSFGVYMLGVIAISIMTTGPWYGLFAAIISVVLFDFFFVAPFMGLRIHDEHIMTFSLVMIATLVVSWLTAKTREQARLSAARALRLEVLLGNSHRLQSATSEEAILHETGSQMSAILQRDTLVCAVHDGVVTEPRCFFCAKTIANPNLSANMKDFLWGKREQEIAHWAIMHDGEAGFGSKQSPEARSVYLPVRGHSETYALLLIACATPSAPQRRHPLTATDLSLARAMATECALALENHRLAKDKMAIVWRMRQEQLRSDVLRTISHDLRTPLASMWGNAQMLAESDALLSAAERSTIAANIAEEAHALSRMVENLLSFTRLEQGGQPLRLSPELVWDVLEDAVENVKRFAKNRVITLELEDELLMARMEPMLIERVIVNLVDNAVKYTQEGGHISIHSRAHFDQVLIEVKDDGCGITDNDAQHIFETFHTSGKRSADGHRGMGLGLTLCRNIVLAHGGELTFRHNTPQGTIFCFTLQRYLGDTCTLSADH